VVQVTLREGAVVKIGRAGDFSEKVWAARQMAQDAQRAGFPLDKLEYIDVAYMNIREDATKTRTFLKGASYKPRVQPEATKAP